MIDYTFDSMDDFYAREQRLWQTPLVIDALEKLHTRHENKILHAATVRHEVSTNVRPSDEDVEITMYAWLRRFEYYSPRYFSLNDAKIANITGRIVLDLFKQSAYFEPILSANHFIDHYRSTHHTTEPIHIFKFEDSRAEYLTHLVREGKKLAIATPLLLEDAAHFNYETGDLVLFTYPNHNASVLVRITQSKLSMFKDIPRRFAYLSGEGDLSLEFFKTAKFIAFNRIYKTKGLTFNEEETITLKTFKHVVTAGDLVTSMITQTHFNNQA